MTTTTDAPEPEDLPEEVKDAMETARLLAEVRAAEQRAAELSTGTDIVRADLRGEAVREQFLAHKRAVAAAQADVQNKIDAAKTHMEAVQQKARNAMRQAEQAMKPLQAQIERMNEGIWSIGMYLGAGEEIVPIIGGEIAEPGTPITIRQGTLAMDEESLLFADEGDFGEDIDDVEHFHEWLAEHPERIDTLLPEKRGIIAIMPTRAGMSADPWKRRKDNFENQTWFLIRNGERVYRLLVAEFSVGPRMLPRQDEFTGFFTARQYNHETGQYETVSIEPGSRQWEEAEASADARARHYMRVALIIQGMLDRTNVFEGVPEHVSALETRSYDSGDIVLLADDENQITSGRKPFKEWQQDLMAQLVPGMRIVGAWNASGFRELRPERQYDVHMRITPSKAEFPPSKPLVVAAAGNGFKATYPRTKETWVGDGWGGGEYRIPKTSASVRIDRKDGWVIPLDLITVEDIDYYVNARSQRGEYRNLIPLLLTAREVLRDEAEQEAPFRAAIAQAIVAADGVDHDDAVRTADELVRWWKFGNKWHRPLVSDDQEFLAKATRRILAEHKARSRATAASDEVVEQLRAAHPDAIAIYRRHSGAYVTYAPEARRYDGVPTDVFLAQYEGKTEKRWVTVRTSGLSRMTEVWTADAWADWQRDPGRHLTDDQIDQVIEKLRHHVPKGGTRVTDGYSSRYDYLPVEGGTLVAVNLYRNRGGYGEGTGIEAHDSAVGWYSHDAILDDTERGIRVPEVRAQWKHTRDGLVIEIVDHHNTGTWDHQDNGAPWGRGYRATSVFRDDAAIVPLAKRAAELVEGARQARRLTSRRWTLARPLEMHFEQKAREGAKAAYVEQFGDDAMYDSWLQRHPIPRVELSQELKAAINEAVPTWDAPQIVDANLATYAPAAPEAPELSRLRITEPPEGSSHHAQATIVTVGG